MSRTHSSVRCNVRFEKQTQGLSSYCGPKKRIRHIKAPNNVLASSPRLLHWPQRFLAETRRAIENWQQMLWIQNFFLWLRQYSLRSLRYFSGPSLREVAVYAIKSNHQFVVLQATGGFTTDLCDGHCLRQIYRIPELITARRTLSSIIGLPFLHRNKMYKWYDFCYLFRWAERVL